MAPAGFETPVPVSEWPQTHALDCAATGIDFVRGLISISWENFPSDKVWFLHNNIKNMRATYFGLLPQVTITSVVCARC